MAADVQVALSNLKRRHVLDHYGCSASALRLVAEVLPGPTASLFTAIASNNQVIKEITIEGKVKATDAGTIMANRTRAILRLPVILAVIDEIVAKRFHKKIDHAFAEVDKCFPECARRGRQVLDIAFPASLVIEKGLDMHSDACIAQADIKQYYDNLRPLLLTQWMVTNGFDRELSSSFLRIQACPQMTLKIGSESITLANKCVGALTGSRTASAAGRIPLLDTAIQRLHHWKRYVSRYLDAT